MTTTSATTDTATEHSARLRAPRGHTPRVRVFVDRCAGCQECVVRCPTGALSMDARRWVAVAEDAACVGCRQCVRTCPFSAIEVDGPMLVDSRVGLEIRHPALLEGDTSEIRHGIGSWSVALAEAARCLACPDPTCVRGCPAHNDIPSFIGAIRDRNLAGAHAILRRTSVLPDVCARVCAQSAQCEGACSWSLAGGEPVAIGALERFVCDQVPVPPPMPAPAGELSVAVVGSGPAGIGAAWELVEAGAAVTVFERDNEPGGLLGWGIPDFSLPDAVARRPWEQLEAAGVDLHCGTGVSVAQLDKLLEAHDAVVLANGASSALRLPVPGADLDGVIDATSFLKGAKAVFDGTSLAELLPELAVSAPATPRVLVLGGGNTAMDVARSARRLGAAATCIEWLDRRFALVRPDELAEAEAEGVRVRFSATVLRLVGDDHVEGAVLARTRQRSADRLPKVLRGVSVELAADLVVMALGYRADPAFAPALPGAPVRRRAQGLPDRRWQASGVLAAPGSAFAQHLPVGQLALGREVGLSAAAVPFRDRLYAAGDALVGPSTVVEAMAQGRRAARAVLQGASFMSTEPAAIGSAAPG